LTRRPPSRAELAELARDAAVDSLREAGPPGSSIPTEERLLDRAEELRAIWPVIEAELRGRGGPDPDRALGLLWRLWLPMADRLTAAMAEEERRVQGIRGPVGSGKSTLVAMLALLLSGRGLRVLRLSLDDLYLSPRPGGPERGPPGSHDVALGIHLLDAVRRREAIIRVPRFDKGARGGVGDRVGPETMAGPDLVLFEGWFVGNRPLDQGVPAGGAAEAGNRALVAYLPLWERVDALWILRAPSEDTIRRWRHEAEELPRRQERGLTAEAVEALLDRMLRALPPGLHGGLVARPGSAAEAPSRSSSPPPELLLDLGEDRSPIGVRAVHP
jgi:D-glycerate 3-kinase